MVFAPTVVRRAALLLLAGFISAGSLSAQSPPSGLSRIALFEPAGHSNDPTLAAVLSTVADSVELSLVVLQRYDVRRLPPADPDTDLPRVRSYCETNHIDQAILGSAAERTEGGFDFRLLVYDRKTDSITIDRQGSSTGALDMFDATDNLVASLLDGLSGTHLLFGSLTVDTDPPGAAVAINGRDAGPGPLSLRGLPVGAVQISARRAGFEDGSASVTIADGETASASLKLARSMGKLLVQVPSDAQLTISNAEIGQKQLSGPGTMELPTGDYQVEATSAGLASESVQVTVGRNATTNWLPWTRGYLDVTTAPVGATIAVDGIAKGTSPLLVEVDPGTPHRLEAKAPEYDTYVADVNAEAGAKVVMTPHLVPIPRGMTADRPVVLVRRTIDLEAVAVGWKGIDPLYERKAGSGDFLGQKSGIVRVYMCRDDQNLYWRIDFDQVNPFVSTPAAAARFGLISDLRIQIGPGKDLEIRLVPGFGSRMGISDEQTRTYKNLHTSILQSRNSLAALVESVPLYLITPYCNGSLKCVVDLAAKPSSDIPALPGMWVKGAIQTDPRYVDFSR